MDPDTLIYDSLAERPLPKWLISRRDGLNTVQPVSREPEKDNSLEVSFAVTGAIILIVITILTIFIYRKKKSSLQ